MTEKELDSHPEWKSCTFEGAQERTPEMGLTTTFREKLIWLEEMETQLLEMQRRQAEIAAGKTPGEQG